MTDAVKLLKLALEFLVGNEDEGDTIESCSGGLLGKEVSVILIYARILNHLLLYLIFSVCAEQSFAGQRKECECDIDFLLYIC